MKLKISLLIIIALAVLLAILVAFRKNERKPVRIKGRTFFVEVVSDGYGLKKGLGGRDGIEADSGMLFLLPEGEKHIFWMKDMRFDLDFLWIDGGKIVDIRKNVARDFPGVLQSEEGSRAVLEISAGMSDRYGFRKGDDVEFGKSF